MTDLAESTGPAEATEVDAEVATTGTADPASAGTESAESGKDTSDWTKKAQERYDTLTREKYEALSARDRERYRSEQLERRLQELEQAATAKTQTVAPSDDIPTLESVGWDEDKHRIAVAQWSRDQATQAAKTVLAEERTAAQREQFEADWDRKQGEFIKSRPDYAEKVGSLPDSLMTPALAAEIKEMGNPEVAYYLAEHIDKLAEIVRLPPNAQARELGRIEARIEAAKASPPPVSKAPPPPAKIEGTEASNKKAWNDPEISQEEFNKRRRAQLARKT